LVAGGAVGVGGLFLLRTVRRIGKVGGRKEKKKRMERREKIIIF
jgi:hypothetical protein